jgi:hypothetical protein
VRPRTPRPHGVLERECELVQRAAQRHEAEQSLAEKLDPDTLLVVAAPLELGVAEEQI